MTHPFIAGIADRLADRGISSLRYQFPYMEQASRRPDTPKLAQATVCAAVAEPAKLVPKFPIIAGGKSFGGRMTSQAKPSRRCPGCAGSLSSDFRCRRWAARLRSGRRIYPR